MRGIIVFLIICIISCVAFTPAVSADVIEPGMKNIDFNYKITNLDKYPDYVFIAHGIPSPSFEIINSSQFSFYKHSTVSIYAIKKSDFNENQIKNMDDSEIENFLNNSKIISSDIKLEGSFGTVAINDPLDEALLELEITSVNGTKMTIKKSKIIYIYSDGSIQEELIKNQDVLPLPSKNKINYVWYYLVPVIAIVAIGIFLFLRRLK